MASINFYLDKPRKTGLAPIYLTIRCNKKKVKIFTGEKVLEEHFDKEQQLLTNRAERYKAVNYLLLSLKQEANNLLDPANKNRISIDEVKETLTSIVQGYKVNHTVNLVEEQGELYGKSYNFMDLFAGAGGFSEGLLQAESNNKFFNFLLGSDINENCALTHEVRYNYQLGLDAEFLLQDITETSFLSNLKESLKGKKIDVVCGGPPCQSFSLAGKRMKFDKKDDLFSQYLNVIKMLKPKYFVMENVKGILTKEGGKIKERILEEIRSLVDPSNVPILEKFIKEIVKKDPIHSQEIGYLLGRINFEGVGIEEVAGCKEGYIKKLEQKFRKLTPKIVDYKTSKTDERINTIRHGLNMLIRDSQLEKIRREIIKEKDLNYLDNDYFINTFSHFLNEISPDSIIQNIERAFKNLDVHSMFQLECDEIIVALKIYNWTFDRCIERLKEISTSKQKDELEGLLQDISLYKIAHPIVVNSSDYGVPQNRERVLFIGCRKDQKLISSIPPTVGKEDKVTVFEALHDLDFVGNNQESRIYKKVNLKEKYNGEHKEYLGLIKKREIGGRIDKKGKLSYADWSKKGRLNGRFNITQPFYVKSQEALNNDEKDHGGLHNHKTSNQRDEVVRRLEVILEEGDYKLAKEKLEAKGLKSEKRNYNVLKADKQSPTVVTMPDDYVHYNSPRALTVREMARLQSFDDSFVFQGKRSTGGSKRKHEVPQFTLVGNAVPPLMARAIGMEILKNIR